MSRIVLAYSGGLDTSAAIPWLREQFGAEVVTVTLDLGQAHELADVRERALALGAVRAHVIDARDEFIREFIVPALQAGALYEGGYPMATALARPLIAKRLVQVARMEAAAAIAHGCRGKGNDQVRLDVSARAFDPTVQVIAPARLWNMSRAEVLAYAHERTLPIPPAAESPYSTDANLWGRSVECGALEDPWQEPPEEIFTLTRRPADCPDEPAYVEIEFDAGAPVRANGVEMPLAELIESIETIAGAHGVGRIDMMENRLVGIKSREIYEAPAAVLLHAAHRELQTLVIARDLERLAHQLARAYADLVYNGLWFSQLREAIDAFVRAIQPRVTGAVRLKLFKGGFRVVGRRSPFALYDRDLASYDAGDSFDRGATEGFIKIWGLPIETAARKAAAQPAPLAR
ncbi:MAG TPA: argininosuccinate synthase [Vicinamibacterales bacterium]|nr:argininosuccinate synthase [Vicinamibacterales bacterium]